jgi:hypothetical protein
MPTTNLLNGMPILTSCDILAWDTPRAIAKSFWEGVTLLDGDNVL